MGLFDRTTRRWTRVRRRTARRVESVTRGTPHRRRLSAVNYRGAFGPNDSVGFGRLTAADQLGVLTKATARNLRLLLQPPSATERFKSPFPRTSGRTYEVQTSTDLIIWRRRQARHDGNWLEMATFSEVIAASQAKFYRVVAR